MSNKTELQNNNLELQGILDSVNALPNAGGGGIETCNLIINAGSGGGIGTECLIPYVDDNNSIQICYGYEIIWSDLYFKVPKGSAFFLNYGFTIDNGADNIQSLDSFSNYNGVFYQITGDAEITITY